MKSGRRSVGGSRADVMATGTQLDHRSSVLSMEEEVGYDHEADEPVCLGELLACRGDDPSTAAARNLDWHWFLEENDERYGSIVQGMARGQKASETAKAVKLTPAQLHWVTINLAADVLERMGDQVLEEAVKVPACGGRTCWCAAKG